MKRPTVREYLLAVLLDDWPTLMSGGLSVPFAGAALYVSNAYARILFGVLAITAVVAAGFRMWAKEREAHLKTHTELESELDKQGRPKVIVVLNSDAWGTLFLCLTNYTDSPAINLRAGELHCGSQALAYSALPAQVSSGFSPNIQVYCPDEEDESRNWVAIACSGHRKKGTDVSEEMLFALRYTDQEARHEWVTFCRFYYDFSSKRFAIEKQWIEKYQPTTREKSERPILTAP